VVLPEFLRRFRNRLLTDSRFLSFAQSLPLTRPIARTRSLQLFDLLAGFTYSQVLYSCVSLKVFETVGMKGCSLAALEEATALRPERCLLLVKAAVALGLLEQSNQTILLGPHGAALLAQPWIMRFIQHHEPFYRDLGDPVALLRSQNFAGQLASYWAYEDREADRSAYSALMAASQVAVSEQILASYDFRGHSRMLDVGGGTGAFLQAVGKRHPHLELNLFDLPGVVRLADSESAAAIGRFSGDFRHDPLPLGMDVISLVRVAHDHDDDAVLALFGNIRKALTPGSTLLIAEPFAGNKSTARVADAYFNLYFAAMGQGRTRTPEELAALAVKSGFGRVRQWPTAMPLIAGVMSLAAI
jgi:demethylspheroidene O-methyltransferase